MLLTICSHQSSYKTNVAEIVFYLQRKRTFSGLIVRSFVSQTKKTIIQLPLCPFDKLSSDGKLILKILLWYVQILLPDPQLRCEI